MYSATARQMSSASTRHVFVRMSSSAAVAPHSPEAVAGHLYKLVISSPAAFESALDASGISPTPDVADRVLARLANAALPAHRFLLWAARQVDLAPRSYHAAITALAKSRQFPLAWEVVAMMRRRGILCVETFAILMRKYARAHMPDHALYTFHSMDKYGVPPNLAALHALLSALTKSRNVRKAQEIFDSMRAQFPPDAKAYSILLEGWGRDPNLPKMREVHDGMLASGCKPDIVTYGILVDTLCKARRIHEAVDVISDMRSTGLQPTPYIYSVLIHTYGVERRLDDAVATFLNMERDGVPLDVVAYNALTTAFCKAKRFKEAFQLVHDMERRGIAPNARTSNIIISGLIGDRRYEEAYKVFRRTIKRYDADLDTYTMMIKMFCECERIEMALKVWKYMGIKQVVPSMHTFSLMIGALCKKKEAKHACVLLEDMVEKGIRPPRLTFAKVKQLLVDDGREDVVEFLTEKMKNLIPEPESD